MKRAIIVVPLVCAIPLVAQQAPAVTAPQRAERQPVIREAFDVAGAPERPATGWAVSPSGDVGADAIVQTRGPGVRISAPAEVTVFRPGWSLKETFAVGASFQSSAPSAIYGLTLGGANGTAFLVRADGAFAVQPLVGGKPEGGAWTPVGLRPPVDDAPAANRLEIRVGVAEAAFVVNGQTVLRLPVARGLLDGTPGVHVSGGGEVLVAGFTVEGTAVVPPPPGVR